MKRLLVMNVKQARLLGDPTNVEIIKRLVFNDLSVTELAKVSKISLVKVWRRVQAMKKEGLVEQVDTRRVANLEKKVFRASALRYITKEPFDWKPTNSSLMQGQKIFTEINDEMIRSVETMNEIPEGLSRVDFAIAVDLHTISKIYLQEEVREKLRIISHLVDKSGLLPPSPK